ncbi:hypothetical protein [Rhodanobacter denitrificans]|uniref:hypothetical protein n=1 Tax=Rhodanobacter denitrificans TaxID=666685 RepID=UPI0011C04687|nr:hypothetical protein [Rhodanobacter denitrificans]
MGKAKTAKSKNKSNKPLEYQLTVVRVGFGGNSGNGKYFYTYSHDPIHLVGMKKGLKMHFSLSSDTPADFKICQGVGTGFAWDQIIDPQVSKDGRSVKFTNKNDKHCSFNIGIIVHDPINSEFIVCDPEVVNVPDPQPAAY